MKFTLSFIVLILQISIAIAQTGTISGILKKQTDSQQSQLIVS